MDLDRASLKERTDRMLETVTSPAFLEQLEAVRRVPVERRIDEAAKRLTPAALKQAGIELPDDVRVSSRYFEEGDDAIIELGEPEGRISVVPALSEMQPGFLDKLRAERPELFKQLVRQPIPAGDLDSWSVCACVGAGFCGGVGGGP